MGKCCSSCGNRDGPGPSQGAYVGVPMSENSHIIRDMMRKHGLESCTCVKDWVENPDKGSQSKNQLQKLEESLLKQKAEIMKGKKVKRKKLEKNGTKH